MTGMHNTSRQPLGYTCLATVFVAMLTAAPAAQAYDALIEGAKQCTQYFPIKEREYGIPAHLMAAISTIETGRYHKGLGMALPWPWTINVEGKGYYYATKAEAIAETKKHIRAGARSIDIGCMQVNLKHHPNAFSSLEDGFDPEKNVNYAATFLRNNYKDLDNSWVKAAAAYHSRTPSRGGPYVQKVAVAWQKIVTKVQQAQARSGGAVTAGVGSEAAALKQTASAPPVQTAMVQMAAESVVAQKRAMRPIASTRNVKVITVNKGASGERAPVMVITPTSNVASYAPAAGTPQTQPVDVARNDTILTQPKRVEVDNRAAAPHTKSRSTFVFAN